MKNECCIVQDLLPLYQENMVSEETALFVWEHLENCPECGAHLHCDNSGGRAIDFSDPGRAEMLRFRGQLRKAVCVISVNILRLLTMVFTLFTVFRFALRICRFERDSFEVILTFLYIHILFLPLLLAEWLVYQDILYMVFSRKRLEAALLLGCRILLSVAMIVFGLLGLFGITEIWVYYLNPVYLILIAVIWGCIKWQKSKQ